MAQAKKARALHRRTRAEERKPLSKEEAERSIVKMLSEQNSSATAMTDDMLAKALQRALKINDVSLQDFALWTPTVERMFSKALVIARDQPYAEMRAAMMVYSDLPKVMGNIICAERKAERERAEARATAVRNIERRLVVEAIRDDRKQFRDDARRMRSENSARSDRAETPRDDPWNLNESMHELELDRAYSERRAKLRAKHSRADDGDAPGATEGAAA